MNYTAPSYSCLSMKTKMHKKKLHFISQTSGVVNDMCCKKDTSVVNTLQLNN